MLENALYENVALMDSEAFINHVQALLFSPRLPELPPELADNQQAKEIHAYITLLRKQLGGYAKGDFSNEIHMRGAIAGLLKSLQANMLHLIWQMRQVEGGDFSQRVDFMGEFTDAFNKMVIKLDDALTSLRQKEEELATLANELEKEVEKRGAALAALQKSEESFKYLAEHDSLTGLFNRRSFFAKAQMQLSRDSVMGHHAALALMDVDNFKRINDNYGHMQGDHALRHVADIANSTLRQDDLIGRYGGEEFIFLFSQSTQEQGRLAAERIRELIERHPVWMDGAVIPMTVSFGVISIPPGKINTPGANVFDMAIRMADTALYQAKNAGRNRVIAAEFPQELNIRPTSETDVVYRFGTGPVSSDT